MPIGLVGRKAGMTRVFTAEGASIPVTVVVAEPNRVTLLRTPETDGYRAVQVTTGTKKPSRVSRPASGASGPKRCRSGRGVVGISPERRRRR